jgi:hypothetical protein
MVYPLLPLLVLVLSLLLLLLLSLSRPSYQLLAGDDLNASVPHTTSDGLHPMPLIDKSWSSTWLCGYTERERE